MPKKLKGKKQEFDRSEIKVRGFKRFLSSFRYSMEGLEYSYKYEQSMFIHFIATVLAIALGLFLQLEIIEWALVFFAIGLVLAGELFNTAIEAVVDLVTTEIHPLAKIAKDCGSAATFVLAVIAGIIGLLIYVPHIIDLFR